MRIVKPMPVEDWYIKKISGNVTFTEERQKDPITDPELIKAMEEMHTCDSISFLEPNGCDKYLLFYSMPFEVEKKMKPIYLTEEGYFDDVSDNTYRDIEIKNRSAIITKITSCNNHHFIIAKDYDTLEQVCFILRPRDILEYLP
jgi:hypothetical protein